MKLDDFNYHLPEELIATAPLPVRSHSRLLVVGDTLEDQAFSQILEHINPGDLVVSNNSRVLKARLFGHKASGGKIEVMLERVLDHSRILAHLRTSKTIKIGLEIHLPNNLILSVSERCAGLFILTAPEACDFYAYLETHGNLPLPPYMHRSANPDDDSRYQTVYAKHDGSVAAPTAGLHFTPQLLAAIVAKGAKIAEVTLHVGSGTFKPVSVADIRQHKMHSEIYDISQTTIDLIRTTQAQGGKIICVGTTSLRTLESAARHGLVAGQAETDIFITPGYQFQVVDKLITNFHLPKSTLLMLVAAFSGKDVIDQAYAHAIKQRYRFFSYGDAMLLHHQHPAGPDVVIVSHASVLPAQGHPVDRGHHASRWSLS